MEKGRLKLELYGQISAVCLNVQKWRLDKEKKSVDPPSRKEWEKRALLFKAAQTNPALLSARLSDQQLEIDGLTSIAVQILFYASELDSFFRTQNVESYPTKPILNSLLKMKAGAVAKSLLTRFAHVYRSVGVTPPKVLDAPQLLSQVLDDLGFTRVTFDPKLTIPARTASQPSDTVVELVSLEKFRLLEVTFSSGITLVRINLSHAFIESALVNGELDPKLGLFFKSYARCMLRMGGSMDVLETFNSYLGLELQEAANLSHSTKR